MNKRKISFIFSVMLIMTSIYMPFSANATVSDSGNGKLLEKMYESYVSENNKENAIINTEAEDKFIEKQNESKKEYSDLIDSMHQEKSDTYKDYYAGSYIDGNGELNVQVTTDDRKISNTIVNITENDDIEINKVQYSYNELNDIYGILSSKMQTNNVVDKENKNQINSIIDTIKSVSISQEKNKVIVGLSDVSESNIALFKKYVVNSSAINFEKADDNIATTTNMYLGHKIGIETSSNKLSLYSIGCWAKAKKDGKIIRGFITAGHKNKVHQTVYYIVSSDKYYEIGKVVGRKCSGSLDCSFVEITNTNLNMTKKVRNSEGASISSDVAATPTEGEIVYKCGFAGGLTKGKILSLNNTVTYGEIGVTLKNLISTNYKTRMGDSGGIVYSIDANGNVFCGIQSGVSGKEDSNQYFSTSYYVDQDYIFNTNWGGMTDILWY